MPIGPGPLWKTRALAFAVYLAFPLAGSGLAFAYEEPSASTVPTAAPSPAATTPAPAEDSAPETSYIEAIGKALDETHESLERNILEQTIRLDNFFGNVNSESLRQTNYELRLRNSLRFEHAWDLKFGMGIRARFTLPRISERLRIVIAGEDTPGPITQRLPQDPGIPGQDRTTPTTHFSSTELRYELFQTPKMNIFLGAGFRLALPFEAFVRSRFQYAHNFNDVYLIRLGETFFVKSTDLLGETSEITLDRLFGRDTILRWASTATASQEIEGVEWGSELSLIRQLSPKNAITLTGGIYGLTSSAGLIGNYRLLARYRQNFLRSWLFYELEPEVYWPRESNGSYNTTFAFTCRLEIVFQGAAPPKENKSSTSSTERPLQDGKKGETRNP